MTPFLYRFRGELVTLWCLAWVAIGWPSRAYGPSLALLATGLGLRIWARRHIGGHSRGRTMACPCRVQEGPYRFFPHPLYLANCLVLAGLGLEFLGPGPRLAGFLAGPLALYSILASGESKLLSRTAPPPATPLDASTRRWRSEWASILPPIAAWLLGLRCG